MNNGLKIIDVPAESYGDALGLRVGDVIHSLSNIELFTVKQMAGLIKNTANKKVTYKVSRDNETYRITAEARPIGLSLEVNTTPIVINSTPIEINATSEIQTEDNKPQTKTSNLSRWGSDLKIWVNNSDVTTLLYAIAGFSLLGGIILSIVFFPTSYAGQNIENSRYIRSILCITVGLAQFSILSALGQGLRYLKKISES